ncbi:MAG: hypothetical protein ACRDL5_12060 [Solirubrobacteraceae bacterium]
MKAHHTPTRPAIAAAAFATIALAIAGCGGSSPTTTTTAGGGPSKAGSIVHDAYAFAACMRTHGIPSFPDPQVSSSDGQQSIRIGVSAAGGTSPAFKSAQKACGHLMPGGPGGPGQGSQTGPNRTALVALAACMRSHGFTRFPDPTAQGQLTMEMIDGAGIDLQAPATKTAALACAAATHGQITRAEIEQAIEHAAGGGQGGTQPTGTTG